MIVNESSIFFSKKVVESLNHFFMHDKKKSVRTFVRALFSFRLKRLDYFVLFQRMSFSMPSKCLMDATWPSM